MQPTTCDRRGRRNRPGGPPASARSPRAPRAARRRSLCAAPPARRRPKRGGGPLALDEPIAADISGLVILLLLFFSVLTASLHLVGRRRWTQREAELASELARTRAALDRANLFLASEPQILVAWDRPDGEPRIEGDFSLVADAPSPRRVLAFASWLEPGLAATMCSRRSSGCSAAAKRSRSPPRASRAAISRSTAARSPAARSCAFATFPASACSSRACAKATPQANAALDALRALLDAIPNPAWTRDADGEIDWVNLAYARAVEAADGADAVARGLELFDHGARRRSGAGARPRAAPGGGARRRSSPAAASCSRRSRSRPTRGAAGIANDLSELETAARRDGAPPRRLFAHARPVVDRGGDLRPRQEADLLQRRLSPDLVARSRLPRFAADRRRDSRSPAREAPIAGAGRLPQLEGAGARRLSGDRADRERLASARRARAARRGEPQSARRRHLSLRRRDPELRARLAGQRHDPRAGRDARRAEGRRRGVRRRRADEADQSGLRRDVALRPARAADRPHIDEVARHVRAAARRRAVVGRPARADRRSAGRAARLRDARRAQGRPGARLRRPAAARRRDAADLPRRDRERQCRARADRTQSGA